MINIGTCSWTEKTLVQSGGNSIQKISRQQKADSGMQIIHTVEVNSTYYKVPINIYFE